ncbi:hypothetical protein IEQ34_006575 [Dendrobium chrysotoxum]|uniref:Uncharacterized protein n=1 Tax=Dendrobium chrysotoxum TaxID=161865 RepID=A0AAV7H814_DENCH|nr:hypothetical protein IEQ34_006575 [Dendrobium chrysotoxum]
MEGKIVLLRWMAIIPFASIVKVCKKVLLMVDFTKEELYAAVKQMRYVAVDFQSIMQHALDKFKTQPWVLFFYKLARSIESSVILSILLEFKLNVKLEYHC